MSDSTTKREIAQGGALGAGVVLVVAILGAVNYLAWRHHERFDWTGSQLYTLSEKSQNVLSSLETDLEIVSVMDSQSELAAPVRELLGRYGAATPRITVRELDAFRNPAEAKLLVERLGIDRADVVVVARADGSDKRVVDAESLAEYDYSGMQYGEAATMKSFTGESEITRAIVELVAARKPKVLVTTGHGEIALDEQGDRGLAEAARLLGGDNLAIEEWASLGATEVPEGTDLVLIAGPRSAFVEPELATFDRYLAAGGRVAVLADPAVGEAAVLADGALATWLAGHGIELGRDIVIDPSNPLPFFGAETIFASAWGEHPITEALAQRQIPVVLPLSRSVTVSGESATTLLRTSASGWGERDLVNLSAVVQDLGDLAGPVGLMAVAEVAGTGAAAQPGSATEPDPAANPGMASAAAEPTAGRLLVVGDADFVTNAFLANAGNGDLLANAVNWLLERENQLGIVAKAPEQVRLQMTAPQLSGARWLVLAGLPALAIVAGIVVQRRRRSR